MRGCGCGSIASARENLRDRPARSANEAARRERGARARLRRARDGRRRARAPCGGPPRGRPRRREPAWGRCGRERVAGAGRPATRRRERGERKGEPGKEGRRARGGVRARARAIFGGEFADDSPTSRRSGRSGTHSGASSRSASSSSAGARSRPPVAIVRDRAADLKDPDFTRGATRFAPGVDDTQTYVDVRRGADGARSARRGDETTRGDDARRARAPRRSGRSTEPRNERREKAGSRRTTGVFH